jgi:DeoR/GlpR family transcriptional regulator of sugar metabolism
MLAIERHREILSLLGKEGSVRVAELARHFDVTEETIRRDFGKLESQGKIVRSHGGAIITEHEETLRPFAWREVAKESEKAAIAQEALKHINPDDSIMLDASTTAWHLAKHIIDMPLTVITNSLQIAVALAHRSQINIHLLGGRMGKKSLSFAGPTAQEQLRQYHADKLFMSCEGIDILRGISDISENHAHLRRIMLSCASHKFLLVDHSKFGVRSLTRICGVEDFDEIITDNGTKQSSIDELRNMDITTTIANN